jgi:hypothetical protein
MRAMVIGLWVMMTKRVSVVARHLVHQIAEALDIVVVERRVDLVEHADRRRVGQEHREDQRQRGQRLLAARKQRHGLRRLPGGRARISSPASSGSSDSISCSSAVPPPKDAS